MEKKFLTREEVATHLRVHIRTVERWLKNGSLKGYKLGKGKTSIWRIPNAELDKFLANHANTK
jgi:excisionase family DNA binding protein